MILLLTILLLSGCASPSHLDTTYCDPAKATNCMAVGTDLLSVLAADSIENEKLKAALRQCQRHGL